MFHLFNSRSLVLEKQLSIIRSFGLPILDRVQRFSHHPLFSGRSMEHDWEDQKRWTLVEHKPLGTGQDFLGKKILPIRLPNGHSPPELPSWIQDHRLPLEAMHGRTESDSPKTFISPSLMVSLTFNSVMLLLARQNQRHSSARKSAETSCGERGVRTVGVRGCTPLMSPWRRRASYTHFESC